MPRARMIEVQYAPADVVCISDKGERIYLERVLIPEDCSIYKSLEQYQNQNRGTVRIILDVAMFPQQGKG